MGAVVLDTSVLLGLLDPKDPHHESVTGALSGLDAADQVLVPTTSIAELLVGAMRAGPSAVTVVEAFIDDVADRVVDIDRPIAREAARLRARHRSLRLPDALVVAAGIVVDAEQVLTADRAWSKVDRRVRVVGGPVPGR